MKKTASFIKNTMLSCAMCGICFALCMIIYYIFNDNTLIPAIFMLGVFLSSVITPGYIYGLITALLSVLAVNFAFTYPFFMLNFTIPENIISALILLVVSIITCSLTAQIKRQESLKAESEKERMRANLLRAVSHDLRTPLTTIYSSSSALLDNYDNFTDEQSKQMLFGIKEDSDWLSRIVENLLAITKLDGENVQLIKTSTAADELIDSTLVKFAKRYPDIKVVVNMPDEVVFIPVDALLIEQVIINLLENSVRHAAGMTGIYLSLTVNSGKAFFEIKDNGCGISEDKLKSIFTGYPSQGNTPSDGKKNNAGIGLSVCASIIKAHGGNITAHNLQEGGCAFCFSLDTEDFENDNEK